MGHLLRGRSDLLPGPAVTAASALLALIEVRLRPVSQMSQTTAPNGMSIRWVVMVSSRTPAAAYAASVPNPTGSTDEASTTPIQPGLA
jgi:hypothetical protein